MLSPGASESTPYFHQAAYCTKCPSIRGVVSESHDVGLLLGDPVHPVDGQNPASL